ncbi:hypothetical protein [Catenulispora rubra]|uniref:hypothetical protein n=1 Tax=Catenulispora rubra TaxID=280293 RepID=UPI0018924031|nr:hypothetical protein [Catenulispora rubra]
MTDTSSPSPAPFTGDLGDPDVPVLREHFRDVTRWVLRESASEQLAAGQIDALAEELAAILATGLGPALSREISHQAETTIANPENGAVSFGYDHQLKVGGFTASDLMKLLDAVGSLVDAGAGVSVSDAISGLHDTHQRMLYNAHRAWLAKNDPEYAASDD